MYELINRLMEWKRILTQLPYYQLCLCSINTFHCRNKTLPITHGKYVEYDVKEILCPYCDYDIWGDKFRYLFVYENYRQERNK